jgi:hypothetical protein
MKARILSTAVVLALCVAGVRTQLPETPEITLTAVSANVAEPGQPVQIRIFRWSSERERTPILVAMDPLPPPPAEADPGGGARGGRAAAAGRGRGRAGRGGAPAAPLTPEAALAGAIRRAPSIGYIWTNDVTGYSIKYAQRMPLPDGGERIVLAVDRRLGEHAAAWQLALAPPGGDAAAAPPRTDYPFTVLDIRLDAKGNGEAKTSLTSKVFVDKESGTLALENHASAPPILQKVRRAAVASRPSS